MFGFLRRLLGGEHVRYSKNYQFLICEPDEQPPLNRWYRRSNWDRPQMLKMRTEYSSDWKLYCADEPVVGTSFEDRNIAFLEISDAPDFRLSLVRERDHFTGPTAIAVVASGTVQGEPMQERIGYLSRERSAELANVDELDCRPHVLWLPYNGMSLGVRVKILVRSARYLKRAKQAQP